MITQAELNTVLIEINKILTKINERLTALEEQSSKPTAPARKKEPAQSWLLAWFMLEYII